MSILGIDLGTTNSLACVWKGKEAYQRVPGECRNTVERFRVMPESNYLNYMRKSSIGS